MIGDVLVSTPLFEVLKRLYPGATLDVLLSSNNYFVLENDPNIRKRWMYTKRVFSTFNLVRSLRRERYDFLVDLMDNPSATSTVLSLLAGARSTVGIEKENTFAYDIAVPMLSRRETHIVDRIAQLLTPFGIDPSKEQLHIRYYPADSSKEIVRRFLERHAPGRVRIVGVNISAGSDVRFWGIENFKELLSRMLEAFPGYPVLLLYKPSDRQRAETLHRMAPWSLLAPETATFDQFAAFVGKLSLLITPDTSAVHLASAFNIPSVVLYVQSNKELRIWEPYHTPCETLVTDVDDLSTIAPSTVFQAASRLIQQTSRTVSEHVVR